MAVMKDFIEHLQMNFDISELINDPVRLGEVFDVYLTQTFVTNPPNENTIWAGEVMARLNAVRDSQPLEVMVIFGARRSRAYVGPSTTVYISDDFQWSCFTRDEKAFFLAHEAGHINLGHNLIPFAIVAHPFWQSFFRIPMHRLGRVEREFEADKYAVELIHRAGFDPHAGVQVMEKLAQLKCNAGHLPTVNSVGRGWRGLRYRWKHSHPPRRERLERIRQFADSR